MTFTNSTKVDYYQTNIDCEKIIYNIGKWC